jgi:hypothetical protein
MRRRLVLAAAVALLGVGTAAPSLAQRGPSGQSGPPEVPDAAVRQMLELGLRNIQRGLCGGLDGCPAATPEEFELPPITLAQARIAMLTGTQSAVARWCGLDANTRSINPMMRLVRQKMKLTERQVALIAVIHGIQQDLVGQHLRTRGECDTATRDKLDAELPKG